MTGVARPGPRRRQLEAGWRPLPSVRRSAASSAPRRSWRSSCRSSRCSAYLAYRFEWRFGLAAVVATFHDIVLTICFIAVMRLEVSLVVVAAVLSMVGYSLNDTIVIFDRVRENLRKNRRDHLVEVLNRSINETLPRSVLTHTTVLATLTALTDLRRPGDSAVRAGDVLRRVHRHVLVGVHRRTGAAHDRAEVARRGWPRRQGRRARAPARAASRNRPEPVLIDTHCHLTDPAFASDRWQAVERMRAAGVGRALVVESEVERLDATLSWAADETCLGVATGCHPHDAGAWSDGISETDLPGMGQPTGAGCRRDRPRLSLRPRTARRCSAGSLPSSWAWRSTPGCRW